MALHAEDLPPALRARLEATEANGTLTPSRPSKHQSRKAAPGRGWMLCATCGERLEWTTSGDATPAAVARHTVETGHGRFESELTAPR